MKNRKFYPAKKVNALFAKVLVRRCENGDVPEGKLMAAVIAQAFADASTGSEMDTIDARRFFVDGRMDAFADMAGIHPDFVRGLYRDAMARVEREPLAA